MSISNVEFMLLQLLDQHGQLSGYEINRLVEKFGFREWAGIGMTSIYVSLTKLKKKELVESRLDVEKKGKGPIPKRFKLLPSGKKILKQEVKGAISSSQSRGARYKLGLAGLGILNKKEKITVFRKRQIALEAHLEFLQEDKYISQGGSGLSQHVRWLFQHSFYTLKTEIEFVHMVLNDLIKPSND